MVLLMKAVDPVSYQDRILTLLHQLQSLDTPRDSYYCDLRELDFFPIFFWYKEKINPHLDVQQIFS